MPVPYGDRSGVPIEPLLPTQWYCDAGILAQPAIEAVETGEIKFVPQAMGEHVFRLDAQHPALVHFAPALVGPSDSGLVWAGRRGLRRGREQEAQAQGRRITGEWC